MDNYHEKERRIEKRRQVDKDLGFLINICKIAGRTNNVELVHDLLSNALDYIDHKTESFGDGFAKRFQNTIAQFVDGSKQEEKI